MTDAPSPAVTYPLAERLDLVEDLHGHRVADPYRWLEDATDSRTHAWSAEQDQLARRWLDALPGREHVAGRVGELLQAGSVSVPVWRAGRAFFTRRAPGQEHAVLHVRDSEGIERMLLDVMALDPAGLTTLDGWTPSKEGDRLAYLLSSGGDEESQLYVMDITTGDLLEGPIQRAKYTSIAWLPDGEEFFYVRRLPAEQVPAGEERFHRRVWRHRVGTDPDTADELVHGEGLDLTYYYGVRLSDDGRWLVIEGSPGTARRDSVWIADLRSGGELRSVLTQEDDVRCVPWVERDGRLYLLTTHAAPRWRLCVADPQRPEPEHWTELVGEAPDSVLDGVRWLDGGHGGPHLVVLRTRHAVAEVHLHEPATGERTGTVSLPGTGSLTGVSTADSATPAGHDTVWIGYTDFVTPPGVHAFSLATGQTQLVESAPGAVERPAVSTRQLSFTSTDGTTVRLFLLAPAEARTPAEAADNTAEARSPVEAADGPAEARSPAEAAENTAGPDRPRPALLTGYGGFSLSREPGYSAGALAWVEAGGVWALASLRGGGEEGEQWHRAGMREHKQNVFDDFHAAAEFLAREGWTTPEQLAIMGGSNGGLLVGAAMTQRPELYRAVICSAPLLDMVRYEKFLIGRTWNDEYGTAADPVELGWLLSYSPYHQVREGTPYPSVLFTVFESDSRVDPNHARKMCAALQHATSSDPSKLPVLLRRETQVGHSTRAVSRTIALLVDQTVFLAHATGLELRP